jgi:hypothetical protein
VHIRPRPSRSRGPVRIEQQCGQYIPLPGMPNIDNSIVTRTSICEQSELRHHRDSAVKVE